VERTVTSFAGAVRRAMSCPASTFTGPITGSTLDNVKGGPHGCLGGRSERHCVGDVGAHRPRAEEPELTRSFQHGDQTLAVGERGIEPGQLTVPK